MPDQEIFAPGEFIPPRAAASPELAQLQVLAILMDSAFVIPGTRITMGIDALIGLFPVVGDTLSALISSYIVKRAHALGVPAHVKAKMVMNIGIDWAIGIVPFVGDAFDIGWKANVRNVELIRRHLEKR